MTFIAMFLGCVDDVPVNPTDDSVLEQPGDTTDPRDDTGTETDTGGTETEVDQAFAEGQTWRGWYTCSQGKTQLTIPVDHVAGTLVDARFEFVYEDIVGSYEISGDYDPTSRLIAFTAGEWIDWPQGYRTVDLKGAVSKDGSTFEGIILEDTCGDFSVALDP